MEYERERKGSKMTIGKGFAVVLSEVNLPGGRGALVLSVFLLMATMAGCGSVLTGMDSGRDRSPLLSALPEDGEISPWKRDGAPCSARGMDELVKQIDGGAPFYLERGVEESVFQEYSKGGGSVWVNVVLHRTATSDQAVSLYRDLYAESPVPLVGLGDEARSLPNLIGVYAVEFRKGNTYASLTVTDTSTNSEEALRLFATTIAKKLP